MAAAPDVGSRPALRGPPRHPLLRPLRHGAVLARARAARRLPRRRRSVGVRAVPARRRRRRPAGVDDDALDAGLQRRRRRRCRHHLRARARRGVGRHRARPDLRRGPPARGHRSVGRRRALAGSRPGRTTLRPPVRPAPGRRSRRCRARLARPRRRLRQHRGRLGHRAPGPRLRRGRLPRLRGRRPAGAQPGDRRRHLRRARRTVERHVRQGCRPGHRRRVGGTAPAGARGPVRAQLPALLAVLDPAHLLGQDVVVRPHVRATSRAAARERDDQLAAAHDQARTVRQLARGQHRLGPVARPLLGHTAADLAVRRLRHRHLRRLGGGAGRARRSGPHRVGPAPPLRGRRHHRLPVVRGRRTTARAGAGRLVRLGLDALGTVPSPLHRRRGVRAGVPRRLHLRGDRPDAGLVLLPARRQRPRVRRHALPQRGVPGAHRRRARSEDVEVARQRPRPVGHLRPPRRRRPALVLLLGGPAVDAPPGRRRRHPRGHPAVAADLVELLVVLRHLRRPRRLEPRRRDDARLPCARSVGQHAARPDDPRGDRCARGVRRPARRHGAGDLRRRPLQLVRAPLPPAVLEGVRPRGTRHAAPVPDRDGAAAGAVLPLPRRRAVRGAHRRHVRAPGRLARPHRARGRRAGRGDGHGAPPRRARPIGASRSQGQGAPAVAPGPPAARRRPAAGRAHRRGRR